jgi:NAD(P)H dehydrogenase (quinone)
VLPPFVGYHVPYIGHDERSRILDDYEVRLSQVDSVTPLRFVSMNDFDGRLHPIAK